MRKTAALLFGAISMLGACAYPYTPPALPPVTTIPATRPAAIQPGDDARAKPVVTILISIDGFRPDYLDRGVTPNLSALAAGGVTAPMRPSFPSKTFPNHWTLVTGLVPDRHGIVANVMDDPSGTHPPFTMATDDPWWWNVAPPIWVTAEQAGIRSSTEFWPGSNVAWGGVRGEGAHGAVSGGVRPEDWAQFNQAITGDQRVAAVLDWLRRPEGTRPRFVTLYFDTVDTAGHEAGPDSSAVTDAVAGVDESIGRLVGGLKALDQPANLVIVADHGMAATSSDRVVALDRIVPPADDRIAETGPYATLYPAPGRTATLEAALLRPHPHMTCWRKGGIPARYHYGTNPRIPPYLCLAETGWSILPTAPARPFSGGNHGYDNFAPEMRALFIANGPAFEVGKTLPPFDNVDIAPLLRDLLHLPPGTGLDGTDAPFRHVLEKRVR